MKALLRHSHTLGSVVKQINSRVTPSVSTTRHLRISSQLRRSPVIPEGDINECHECIEDNKHKVLKEVKEVLDERYDYISRRLHEKPINALIETMDVQQWRRDIDDGVIGLH